MKLRGTKLDKAEEVLGPAQENEFAFIVLPMNTYRALNEQARIEGCTTADVFSRALISYVENANKPKTPISHPPDRVLDVVLKRNK